MENKEEDHMVVLPLQ